MALPNNNKTIKKLVEWIETWPDDLKDQTGKTADRAKYRIQTGGASINLPTSQPITQDRVWRNGRWYIQCQECPKSFKNTKREREAHARTHTASARTRRTGAADARYLVGVMTSRWISFCTRPWGAEAQEWVSFVRRIS